MSEKNSEVVNAKLASFFGPEHAQDIEISKCPDPKEIIWHHLQHFSSRKFKIFYGWLLSLVFLFIFFIIFYFLSNLKAQLIIEAAN